MSPIKSQHIISKSFYDTYDRYKESSLNDRRFKHSDILPIIEKMKSKKIFEIVKIGESLEEREINLIKIGNGSITVLAWSQMHGDESTATGALFDLLNFFSSDDEFNDFRKDLLNKVTLYFIPMLNPDGAERFTRRNALQIDLNRDALRLEFPESKALKNAHEMIKPVFGFNLHDQSTRYSAGISFKTATISFLTPPFNYEKEINDVRTKTMQVIVDIYNELNQYIPGHMAKYSDDFEPRAFGDNFIKWGTSSVLIESGGWKNDEEKQFIRKINFIALLTGFQTIANGYYESEDIQDYYNIPDNDKLIFDLLLRNLKIKFDNKFYTIDIGVNLDEFNTADKEDGYFKGFIEDIGDLSIYHGYKDIDCEGMEVIPGNTAPAILESENDLTPVQAVELLKQGHTFVRVKNLSKDASHTTLPINLISDDEMSGDIEVENDANFIIKQNGQIKYVILNGFLFNPRINGYSIKNGLIFR